MEAKSEREVLIKLDSKVSQLAESIDRLTTMLEKLEDIKLKDLEQRLSAIERWMSGWRGVYVAISIVALIAAIYANINK